MNSTAQLDDLVGWLGSQRKVARVLGRPQRQVWGWLAGEHKIQGANRLLIAQAWQGLDEIMAKPQGNSIIASLVITKERPTFDGPKLRALPTRPSIFEAEEAETYDFEGGESGYFVPIDDYGARHTSGALARRPATGT